MGNRCCAPELDKYQIKVQQKIQIVQQKSQRRKGYPSQKIAVRVTDINKIFKTQEQLQNINRMIFIVAEDERKKFKQPMRINKQAIVTNRIKQVFYIQSLRVFYIGQWIFNQSLNENVPGGIGRLYEDGTISEGVFKTFLKDADEIENLYNHQYPINSKSSIVFRNNDESNMRFSRKVIQENRIEKLLKADRQKLVNQFHFDIKLDGQGRISSTQDEGRSQISLEGQFSQGKLNGRGTLKMITNQQQEQINQFLKKNNKRKKDQSRPRSNSKSNASSYRQIDKNQDEDQQQFLQQLPNQKIQRKTQYFYSGFWKMGSKHGKGVQKVQYFFKQKTQQLQLDLDKGDRTLKHSRKTISTQSFRYQGSFHENTKHGKGNITFLGSNKHQHQVQRDIERMQKQIMSEGQNIKAQSLKKVFLLEQQQLLIQSKLDSLPQNIKSKLKKSNLKLKKQQRLLLFDSTFNSERKYRKIYNQNYIGDFRDGRMEGSGTYTWPNGKIYRGKWQNDKMHGRGQFYWPDGTCYIGQYENDQRNGEGIMIWNIFKRYRGDWAFGMRHGYGEAIQLISSDPHPGQQQRKQKLVIKGYIWDRDKVKKALFEQVIQIPASQVYILQRKADQKYDEQMLVKDSKKNKQVSKIQNFKQAAEYRFNKFSSTVSKLVSTQ